MSWSICISKKLRLISWVLRYLGHLAELAGWIDLIGSGSTTCKFARGTQAAGGVSRFDRGRRCDWGKKYKLAQLRRRRAEDLPAPAIYKAKARGCDFVRVVMVVSFNNHSIIRTVYVSQAKRNEKMEKLPGIVLSPQFHMASAEAGTRSYNNSVPKFVMVR